MKNIILLIVTVFMFSGCSVLKSVVAPLTPVKNSIPQKESKGKKIVRCKGDITIEDGRVVSCSGGFYSSEKTFNKEERKLNFRERVGQFISRLSGYAFWFVIISILFFPGLIGLVFGRTFNGFRSALESTVRAIKNAKNFDGKYMESLSREHGKDKKVKKIVNEIRANL